MTELRGNDLWICLPDGDDDDVLTDGCVRFASIRDTSAEPTGFKFIGSGESAYVNIQHRAINDSQGNTNHGALIKISGFKVNPHRPHHRPTVTSAGTTTMMELGVEREELNSKSNNGIYTAVTNL